MIKIGLADGHPAVISGLKSFFDKKNEIIVRDFCSEASALDKFLRNSLIEILVIDNENLGILQLTDFKKYVDDFPAIKFLVYSSAKESSNAVGFLRCGAMGFIEKSAPLDALECTILQISNNETGFSPTVVEKMRRERMTRREDREFKKLSKREVEILRYFCDGKKNKEIATTLSLDEKTVSTYKTRLLVKLGVTNLVDLVLVAKKNEIV